MIDAAGMYGMERFTREAVCNCCDKAFSISEVLPGNASPKGTTRSCRRSLWNLGADYIDLYCCIG